MTKAPSVSSTVRSVVFVALSAMALTSCLRTLETEGDLQKFGAIVLKGSDAGPNASEFDATGIFFQSYGATIPNSRGQANTCQFSVVDTTTREAIGQLQAGQSLSLSLSGTATRTTQMAFEAVKNRYSTAGSVPYASGDSVTITIPGNSAGYPASAIKVRLAEPLTVPDVTIPATGTPMAVSWNKSSDTTTAVYLSLKYANPPSTPYANEQVLCSLSDDGAENIPASSLTPFFNSPVALRSLTVTRWRTNVLNPAEKTLLHIVSTVETQARLK